MSDSVRPHRRQPTKLPRPWDSPGKNTGVGCHFPLQCLEVKSESEVAQSCLTLSDPMDCSPPGSSLHGIFQARVLEWVCSNSQIIQMIVYESSVKEMYKRLYFFLNLFFISLVSWLLFNIILLHRQRGLEAATPL